MVPGIQKNIVILDAILDCVPIVSSLSNAAWGLYKLAHKVDTVNPVAPGWKTSLKIHALTKGNFSCFVGFIPVLGNLCKLMALVVKAIYGFDDPLLGAVFDNHKGIEEIVRLSLGNRDLEDQKRANEMLLATVLFSKHAIFNQIFSSRSDWNSKILLHHLKGDWFAMRDLAGKANSILDYWEKAGKVLKLQEEEDLKEVMEVILALDFYLKNNEGAVVKRIVEFLPERVPFCLVQRIISPYAGHQKDAWMQEIRNMLINKCESPTCEELGSYFYIVHICSSHPNLPEDYFDIYVDVLNKLLSRSTLKTDEIDQFIQLVFSCNSNFFDRLLTTYRGTISFERKIKILMNLRSSPDDPVKNEQQIQSFRGCIDQWADAISAQAHELYIGVEDPFKNVLREKFPDCDKVSENLAVNL